MAAFHKIEEALEDLKKGKDDSNSVKNQRDLLNDFYRRNIDEFESITEYVDDGHTGTDANREDFQRLLADVMSGKINCVIVKDLSRFARNYSDAGSLIDNLFVQMGVRFISLAENVDSYKNPDSVSNIIVPITNVMNDNYCYQTSKKIRQVFDYKRRNGQYIGAFALIFEKGTGVIEKTYQRTKLEQDYQVRQYMADVKQNSKSLRSFSKKARDTGTKNLLLSGVSGIGMGVLGIGLPDIPVFTGMILKNIYETALQYGYSYESREEKYFILLLIRGAVSYGDTLCEIDGKVNEFIRNGILPEEYQDKEQIEQTAGALSKELLYMKFLQGIPVVGAVGGAYDAVYMKRITEYAELKYRHRYLAGRKKAENGQLCKRCKSYRDI